MIAVQHRQPRENNNGIKNPIHITTQDKQRLEDLLVEVAGFRSAQAWRSESPDRRVAPSCHR